MELENAAQILIYTHAGFGGIALISGAIALIVKKGSKPHRKSGKIFFYSMLLSAILALVISVVPNHESPFLFAIALFSSYFILTGYRALRLKSKHPNLKIDKLISWCMILTGIAMIAYPIILDGSINIILTAFGTVGLFFSIRDLVLFKDHDRLRKDWLKLHLGKMMGGYIAAVTAFVVVNDVFPGVYGWFIPGVVGGLFIAFWINKLNKKSSANMS